MRKRITAAFPTGSLEKPGLVLLKDAGFTIEREERCYSPKIDDPEIELLLLRPQDMPRYVAKGMLDLALCGFDCMVEANVEDELVQLAELPFSKVSCKPTVWVLAVPEESDIAAASDLQGKCIETEMPVVTAKWLMVNGVSANVVLSRGATEVKPGRFCDAIVEATETGKSLRKAHLNIVTTVLTSTPRLITSAKSMSNPWKQSKMQDIARRLTEALFVSN